MNETRRGFFRQFLAETICLFDEISGIPQMRLSDLDHIPDDIVCRMIPVFNKSCLWRIDGDCLMMKRRDTGSYEEICHLNSREILILQCFDGHYTLEDIGRMLEDRFGQSNGTSYQQVKSLFVFLAKRMICHPAHAHD